MYQPGVLTVVHGVLTGVPGVLTVVPGVLTVKPDNVYCGVQVVRACTLGVQGGVYTRGGVPPTYQGSH